MLRVLASCTLTAFALTACSTSGTVFPNPSASSATAPAASANAPLSDPLLLSDGSSAGSGTPLVSDATVRSQRFDVLIDGWSLKTLGDTPVRWEDSSGASGTLTFTPVSSVQVAALREQTPEILTHLAARMISPAADMACSTSGCSGSHAFDPSWVSDPSKVPVLGSSYTGYGITSLLEVASIAISEDAESVTFTTPESSRTVSVSTLVGTPSTRSGKEEYPSSATAPASVPAAAEPTTADMQNGYLRNRALLFASFGALFSPSPSWLGSADTWMTGPASALPASSAAAAVDAARTSGALPAFDGLQKPWAPAQTLSNSQLTFYSSPTTGCGTTALCAPVATSPKIDQRVQDLALCKEGSTTPYAARFVSTKATVDLPAPTNQFWMWGVVGVRDLKPPTAGGASYGSLPPKLASGPSVFYWDNVLLLSAPSGELVNITGLASESAMPGQDADSLLAKVPMLAASWHTCG